MRWSWMERGVLPGWELLGQPGGVAVVSALGWWLVAGGWCASSTPPGLCTCLVTCLTSQRPQVQPLPPHNVGLRLRLRLLLLLPTGVSSALLLVGLWGSTAQRERREHTGQRCSRGGLQYWTCREKTETSESKWWMQAASTRRGKAHQAAHWGSSSCNSRSTRAATMPCHALPEPASLISAAPLPCQHWQLGE